MKSEVEAAYVANKPLCGSLLEAVALDSGGKARDYLRARNLGVYLPIPTNESYLSFIKLYPERLQRVFIQYSVTIQHNHYSLAMMYDPQVFFPKTFFRGQAPVILSSDNEGFMLMDRGTVVAELNFRPFGPNTLELSLIYVNKNYRGKEIGTTFVNVAQHVIREMDARLTLFPCPPLRENVNAKDSKRVVRRLRDWYGKLGFVNGLPEMFQGYRLINDDAIVFGLCNLMVFR